MLTVSLKAVYLPWNAFNTFPDLKKEFCTACRDFRKFPNLRIDTRNHAASFWSQNKIPLYEHHKNLLDFTFRFR